jgi:hypothetical protein
MLLVIRNFGKRVGDIIENKKHIYILKAMRFLKRRSSSVTALVFMQLEDTD